MPRLDIYHNFKLLLQVQLSQDVLSIGRGKDCQVSLNDPEISRCHALICRNGETWEVQNQGRNGTRLNGSPVNHPTALNFGDRLYIGRHAVVFQDDAAPAIKDEALLEAPTGMFQGLDYFAKRG
jgi:pSer/pThr/pTyr-binding forkhead associated (FHA) protein